MRRETPGLRDANTVIQSAKAVVLLVVIEPQCPRRRRHHLMRRVAPAPPFQLDVVVYRAAATGGKVVPAPSGVLLRTGEGEIMGAIGVSGDNSDADEACAILAAAEVGLRPEPSLPAGG